MKIKRILHYILLRVFHKPKYFLKEKRKKINLKKILKMVQWLFIHNFIRKLSDTLQNTRNKEGEIFQLS